jgi:hypothetical protein
VGNGAYALLLELQPVDDGAEVVAQVQVALGLDAREDAPGLTAHNKY